MTASQSDSWPLIEDGIRRLFEDQAAPSGPHPGHVNLGPRLEEMGWNDIEADSPLDATRLLFRMQAQTLAQTDVLARVMLAELTALFDEAPIGILLPPLGAALPASVGDRVTGILIGPVPEAGSIAIALDDERGGCRIVAADVASLVGRHIATFDPSVEWTAVTARGVGPGVPASAEWTRSESAGQRAIATELVALSDRILQIACEHASGREQFGSAIGSFQVIRHDLAQCYARIEGVKSLLDDSWNYGGRFSALAVKAVAGRTHRAVSDVAIQVCAAIGLTAEHDLHRYVRRGIQLDSLLGSHDDAATRLRHRLFDISAPTPPLPAAFAR